MAWRIALFGFSALLMGAHYLRQGDLALVALCLCVPLLFFWRRRWILFLLQAFAYAAAARWFDVAVRLVFERQQFHRDWVRAGVILGLVVVVTFLAGAVLNSRAITQYYPR